MDQALTIKAQEGHPRTHERKGSARGAPVQSLADTPRQFSSGDSRAGGKDLANKREAGFAEAPAKQSLGDLKVLYTHHHADEMLQ